MKATSICAICGEFVDQSLKWPHQMSPSIDHIVPVSQLEWNDERTWSIDNARLTHLVCNQRRGTGPAPKLSHPQSRNWLEDE